MDLARSLPGDKRRDEHQAQDAERLEPKRHWSGYRGSPVPCHGHATLPADRAHLTRPCQSCGTWQARIAPSLQVGKPQGPPMAMRVRGWEKANAVLSWDGYGWQHHPARKRADFPAVSRHENHGGIDTEGVANVGGQVPLVLPSPCTQRTRKLSMDVSWS